MYPLDDPKLPPNDSIRKLFFAIDLGIWIFFVLELVLRVMISMYIDGLQAFHVSSMFFDFVILVLSIFNFVGFQQTTFGMIGKVLKVVVVFTKIKFVKHIVKYLLMSIRPILSIYLYLIVFYLCFAVVFVRYQAGANFYCDTVNLPVDFVRPDLDRQTCVDIGGDWLNYGVNFDNVYQACRSLFVMSTGDGWFDQLWKSFDSNSVIEYPPGVQYPEFGYMRWIYIVFMILFFFFLLDVFTGTIIHEYYKQKNKEFGIDLLSTQQLHWVYLQSLIMNTRPVVKYQRRNICGFLSSDFFTRHRRKFEIVQLAIYASFMIIWSTASYPMSTSSTHYKILSGSYNLFIIVWGIELLMSIYVERLKFFRSTMNWITIIHFAGSLTVFLYIVTEYGMFSKSTVIDSKRFSASILKVKQNDLLTVTFRTLLILRTLTAVRYFYNITIFKKIIKIFINILPSFAGMIMIILVIIFIFSCAGFYSFTYTAFSNNDSDIGPNANFSTFFLSFATLLRICFADNFSQILIGLTSGLQPNRICHEFDNSYDNYLKYGMTECGSPNAGFFFLYIYYTTVNFFFFNILIALVLDSFEITYQQEATSIQSVQVKQFRKAWMELDQKATGMIKIEHLAALIKAVDYPLSLPVAFKQANRLKYMAAKLNLPLYFKRPSEKHFNNDQPEQQAKIGTKEVVNLLKSDNLYYHFHDALLAMSHYALMTNASREYKE